MNKFLSNQKIIFQTVTIMTFFGLIFSAFLGFFFETTSPIIQKSEAEAKKKMLLELISNEVYDNDIEKDFISMSSMKQWILEEDIGKMCSFLISDDSSKVSGQVISVDGHTERND